MNLTRGQRAVLQQLWDHRDEWKGQLVQAVPGGWWLGNHRIQPAIGWFLLRCCLVRTLDQSPGGLTIYVASPEVGDVLADANYVPLIFQHQPDLAPIVGAKL